MEKEYEVVDLSSYYRKDVYRHFTEDVKCSTSITSDVDVTSLVAFCKDNGLNFYITFLFLLSKILNSKEDYRYSYDFRSGEVRLYKKVSPSHYIFHDDTKTFTICYTEYDKDFATFYARAKNDIEKAKARRDYGLDDAHPNYFDASYISWINYSSLNIELPDGYIYLNPIINWGRYTEKEGKLMLPLSVRMNHAIADGYHISYVFTCLSAFIQEFVSSSR